MGVYWDYTTRLLLPLSLLSGCKTMVATVRHLQCRKTHSSAAPEVVFFLLQWVCYSMVSSIMMRFTVLFEPCAILLASMVLHPGTVDSVCTVMPSFVWVGFR